jgi:hypothetical protein
MSHPYETRVTPAAANRDTVAGYSRLVAGSPPSALDFATLAIAVYAAGLASYSQVVQRRPRLRVAEEPTWRVKRGAGSGLRVTDEGRFWADASLAFRLRVTNVGSRPVTLVAIIWHRSEDDAIDLESQLIADDWWVSAEFPQLIGDGESADFYLDVSWAASTLRWDRNGWFEVRDSAGRRWRARADKNFRQYVLTHPDDLRRS